MVLPLRAAFNEAVSRVPHSPLVGKVRRRLKKSTGIIRKKQWWNLKTCKQVNTRWFKQNERQELKTIEIQSKMEARDSA